MLESILKTDSVTLADMPQTSALFGPQLLRYVARSKSEAKSLMAFLRANRKWPVSRGIHVYTRTITDSSRLFRALSVFSMSLSLSLSLSLLFFRRMGQQQGQEQPQLANACGLHASLAGHVRPAC